MPNGFEGISVGYSDNRRYIQSQAGFSGISVVINTNQYIEPFIGIKGISVSVAYTGPETTNTRITKY